MEFNDLFRLHVPDILSAIFLHLSPPDLEAAYVVCAQWRHFIEAHLLSNELTLARLVRSKVRLTSPIFSHAHIKVERSGFPNKENSLFPNLWTGSFPAPNTLNVGI